MAQSTGGMFSNLFGLGPLFQAFNDPEFQNHARAFLYYISDTHRRVCEIEEMLRQERGLTSAIPPQYRTAGNGGLTATAGAHNNGGGGVAPPPGEPQPGIRGNGQAHEPGEFSGF